MIRNFSPPGLRGSTDGCGAGFAGKKFEANVEAVKVIGVEGSLQNAPELFVIVDGFEFFGGAADGEIVDDNLALFEGALTDASQLSEFEIAEALNADPDAGSEHSENQSQGTACGPEQEQTEEREHGGYAIENNHDLAVSESVLQEFVVNVLAVGGEDGTSADQAAENGERGFEDGQSERNYRDGDSDDGGRFLGTFESEGAEQESDEEAAGISEENCGGIEVVAQKAKDGAGESDGHHGDEGVTVQERDDEGHESGEQGGTGGEAVEAVDQVEGVGDGEDPQDGEGQAHKPRELMFAEQYRDIKNAQAAHEEHGGGERLNGKLYVGADGVEIVINSEKENDRSRNQNGEYGLQRKRGVQVRKIRAQERSYCHAQRKGNEDSNAAEARQRSGVEMPPLRRNGDPSAAGGNVAHIAGEDEREQQRQKENSEKYYRQQSPSASDHERRRTIEPDGKSIAAGLGLPLVS